MVRSPRKFVAIVAALCIAGGVSLALAQETGVVGELERLSSTSTAEKQTYVEEGLAEMTAGVKTATDLLEKARKDGDAEGVQCVLSRLTAMRALLDISGQAATSMNSALAENEPEMADHEFRKIAVARNKSAELLAEAERCTDKNPADGQAMVDVTGGEEGDDDFLDPFGDITFEYTPDDISPFQ
jgi:hypothetical protein